MRYNTGIKDLNTYQYGMVKCAIEKIRNDKTFLSQLERLFQLKSIIPHSNIKDFNEWLETLCKDVVFEDRVEEYNNIYWAVKISTVGTEESYKVQELLISDCREEVIILVESEDYEEKGDVYASVKIKGTEEGKENLAEKAKKAYQKKGFKKITITYDEEMEGEVTVTAEMPLIEYVRKRDKGGIIPPPQSL